MASRERLGTAVAARRRHLGMSVPEAARRSGLDRETWRHLEAGTRTLRSYNHSRVERALNWAPGSVEAILGGGDPTVTDATTADPEPERDEGERLILEAPELSAEQKRLLLRRYHRQLQDLDEGRRRVLEDIREQIELLRAAG